MTDGTVFVVVPGARLDIVTNSSSEVFVTADGRGVDEVRAAILAFWEQWKDEHDPGWKEVAAFEADGFASLKVSDGSGMTSGYGDGKPRPFKKFYMECAKTKGSRDGSGLEKFFLDKASHPQAVFYSFSGDSAPYQFREDLDVFMQAESLFLG